MTRILAVDDQVLFREGLINLINSQSDMKVIAAVNEAKDALKFCEKYNPDLVIMDILTDPLPKTLAEASGPTGIAVTAQIRQKFPNIKVIIMTGLSDISLLEAAKKAGAHGFLNKSVQIEQFIKAIRQTMEGFNAFYEKSQSGLPFACSFDDREIQVLRLFCKGLTRPEVAEELCISESLVKAIVTNLLNKTGFDSILRLAIFLTSNGYIQPNID